MALESTRDFDERTAWRIRPAGWKFRQLGWEFRLTNLTERRSPAPASQATPEVRRTNTYSIQDNANWVHGGHSIAFGFQVALLRTTDAISSGVVPSFGLGVSSKSPYGYKTGDIPGPRRPNYFARQWSSGHARRSCFNRCTDL